MLRGTAASHCKSLWNVAYSHWEHFSAGYIPLRFQIQWGATLTFLYTHTNTHTHTQIYPSIHLSCRNVLAQVCRRQLRCVCVVVCWGTH